MSKYLYGSKKNRENWAWNHPSLRFRFGDNALGGYCILYTYDDKKISKANGCGYDKQGTIFADFLEDEFREELQRFFRRAENRKKYYGVIYIDGKVLLDGACGFESMRRIFEKLGFGLRLSKEVHKSKTLDLVYSVYPL